MSIPTGYKCNQWGWFWRESDNSGPWFLGADGEMHQNLSTLKNESLGVGDLTTDAWGVQKVSIPKSVFHGMWTFDIPANMWFMYHNGVQVYANTSIVSSGGAATLLTSAANSSLILESRECPRYQPNRGHLFSTALFAPNKLADGIREWGLQTTENGIFFRLKGDGLLYAVRKSGGVQKEETLLDTSAVASFNVEAGNIYDIQCQWRGVGNYKFFINNVLVYTMSLLGTLTELSIQNLAMPISFRATRITQDVGMSIGCADITSENGTVNIEQYNSSAAESVPISTNTPVLCLHSPLQIAGSTNTRTVTLARISFTASKKATFKVWLTRNPAAITGATFIALGSGSFLETDSVADSVGAVKATSVNVALMTRITTVPVEAIVTSRVDNPYRGRIEFPLVRGDYLVITGTGASATTDVVVEVGEQI